MGKQRKWPPPVYIDNRRNEEYMVWYDPAGNRHRKVLGPAGSQVAKENLARYMTELAAGHYPTGAAGKDETTVGKLTFGYLCYSEKKHTKKHHTRVKRALLPVRRLYASMLAKDFGPVALEAVQASYVLDGLEREYCNTLLSVVKGAWKWAARRQLIDATWYAALLSVPGLEEGQGVTGPDGSIVLPPEGKPVMPVEWSRVEATLPHLVPTVADMVRLERLTAARMGEICQMRGCDIDRNGKVVEGVSVWVFRPLQHKKRKKGAVREVAIGPAAQAILAPYLANRPETAFCFSPREAVLAWLTANKRKVSFRRSRAPGERYTTGAIDHAVAKACARAFPHPELAKLTIRDPKKKLTKEQRQELRDRIKRWNKENRWRTHQVRKLSLTDAQGHEDIDVARAMAGHDEADMTMNYAKADLLKAARYVAKHG